MNILYKVFSLLALSALCLNTNPAKAGVCFVVGGDCGETNQVREDKNCLDLGYKYVTDADCVNDNPMYAVVDKDSASCVQNRITYYKSCKCDTSKYKWQTENVGSNYEIVSSPNCHDSYGDHYKYRKCKTSTFKKMKLTLINTEAVAGVLSQISRCLNTLDGVMCHANSTPTDECSQDSDYISTLNLSNDRCYMDVAKKYKKCVCNTSTYKYHDSLSEAFAVDGDYCIGNASNKLNVIDISGRIPYLNGELTLYSGIKCSGKTSGLGTWQKEPCGDGYKQTDRQTLDGLTCRVCEPDPCDVGYTYASSAAECSGLFGAGTQCVQKSPKNSSFTGVCLKKATCDDVSRVVEVTSSTNYIRDWKISSSNAQTSGYITPSNTYIAPSGSTSLSFYVPVVSGTGQILQQLQTQGEYKTYTLSVNDQTCYWSEELKCSGDYALADCPSGKICMEQTTNGKTCYRLATCEDVDAARYSFLYTKDIVTGQNCFTRSDPGHVGEVVCNDTTEARYFKTQCNIAQLWSTSSSDHSSSEYTLSSSGKTMKAGTYTIYTIGGSDYEYYQSSASKAKTTVMGLTCYYNYGRDLSCSEICADSDGCGSNGSSGGTQGIRITAPNCNSGSCYTSSNFYIHGVSCQSGSTSQYKMAYKITAQKCNSNYGSCGAEQSLTKGGFTALDEGYYIVKIYDDRPQCCSSSSYDTYSSSDVTGATYNSDSHSGASYGGMLQGYYLVETYVTEYKAVVEKNKVTEISINCH